MLKVSLFLSFIVATVACGEKQNIVRESAGFCHHSNEFGFIFRPCEDQFSSCETEYLGQRYKHPLFTLKTCRECMDQNELIADEIESVCARYDFEVQQ